MTPELAHFWPQWHNLNNLGRGLLGDATYQISSLYVVSDNKISSRFPYIILCTALVVVVTGKMNLKFSYENLF